MPAGQAKATIHDLSNRNKIIAGAGDRLNSLPMQHRSLYPKLLSAAINCGAWEIAGRIPVSHAFPTFVGSMAALVRMLFDGTMFVAYGETLRPLIVGVAISAVIGIALGLWIGLIARFGWLFSPVFILMQAAPLAALIPILVMVCGIGVTSKVFVVCVMAMPVIVLNTASAVRNTPASLKEMSHCFLASDRDVLPKIILPAASPVIFSGSQLRGLSAGCRLQDQLPGSASRTPRRRPHRRHPRDHAGDQRPALDVHRGISVRFSNSIPASS